MEIVTFTNGKGGVGKTTLAVHTAYLLAAEYGRRVLLVDLDRQWQATKHLGLTSGDYGAATFIVGGGRNLADHVTVARPGLSVLTGSEMTQGIDVMLGQARKPATYLRSLLAFWEKEIDVVVIDTPAHGYLNEMSIVAADLVAVPTPPRHMDTDGVQIFAGIWGSASAASKVKPPPVAIVPNMVDNRTSATGDLLDSLQRDLSNMQALKWSMVSAIPINTNFGWAYADGQTLFELRRKAATRETRIALRSMVADVAGMINLVPVAQPLAT